MAPQSSGAIYDFAAPGMHRIASHLKSPSNLRPQFFKDSVTLMRMSGNYWADPPGLRKSRTRKERQEMTQEMTNEVLSLASTLGPFVRMF